MAAEQGKMVSKRLCPSAHLYAPGPWEWRPGGEGVGSLTADTAATRAGLHPGTALCTAGA